MKLYTEEQVRLLLDLAKLKINGECYSKETLLENVAPIELPSDEDLNKWIVNHDYEFSRVDIQTAKWVIEQIKNNAR